MLPEIKMQKYEIASFIFRGSIIWNALADVKIFDNVAGT